MDQRLKAALFPGVLLCRDGRQIMMPGVKTDMEVLSPIVMMIDGD